VPAQKHAVASENTRFMRFRKGFGQGRVSRSGSHGDAGYVGGQTGAKEVKSDAVQRPPRS
jgi:hypothetical protein